MLWKIKELRKQITEKAQTLNSPFSHFKLLIFSAGGGSASGGHFSF